MKMRLRKITLTKLVEDKKKEEPCTCGCCGNEQKDGKKKETLSPV